MDLKVLIVDHRILFRETLSSPLDQEEGLQVVDQAGSVREALEKTNAWQPDFLFLDDLFLESNGIEFIPILLFWSPKTKIVLLTALDDEQFNLKALESGGKGYLTISISYSQLFDSVKAL